MDPNETINRTGGNLPWDNILPWEWQWHLDAIEWIWGIAIAVLIWFTISAMKYRKQAANQLGRNVEDFAGQTTEANGKMPVFLMLTYAAVTLFFFTYTLIYFFFGYTY